jgi:hypothetical protein
VDAIGYWRRIPGSSARPGVVGGAGDRRRAVAHRASMYPTLRELMASVPPDPARLAPAPDLGLGARISVQVERTVDAPMERVWALLRDYRLARPRLLTEHFSDYAVHHGGAGAGTLVECHLRVGRHRASHDHRPRTGCGSHARASVSARRRWSAPGR